MRNTLPSMLKTETTSEPAWRKTVKELPGVRWLRKMRWSPQWGRIVMDEHCLKLVESLAPHNLDVLEISGTDWERRAQFKNFKSVHFPDYDVCAAPLNQQFDLIIAEQVFEHLLWPYRAARNIHQMLKPGGHFLISTPFLAKVHPCPVDCSRWTELGMKHLLAECGFPLDQVQTYSWGNRVCIKSNWHGWTRYRPWHSLSNEPDFPYVVWALAHKPREPQA